jgi:Zn-dependent peptidase ImmA (M78 family)
MNYAVESKSRKDLRMIAHELKDKLGLKQEIFFPIVDLLDVYCEMFDNFSYEIVEESEMESSIHADTDVKNGHIRIKESVYLGAINGSGRDRMTIAHEIGHFTMINACGFKLNRTFSQRSKAYNDPEWQAKCFAAELLIDNRLVSKMSAEEITEKCGVSFEAASYQCDVYQKERANRRTTFPAGKAQKRKGTTR